MNARVAIPVRNIEVAFGPTATIGRTVEVARARLMLLGSYQRSRCRRRVQNARVMRSLPSGVNWRTV